MSVVSADWLPYALPLKSPWRTSRGTLRERQGRLLRLQNADGRTGWGDAAPLPEFGITETAARDFAEETAHLDLLAQKAGLPLYRWLSGSEPFEALKINANAGTVSQLSPALLALLAGQGYTVIKLKVGTLPVAAEIRALQDLLSSPPPALSFRLDANRAWTFAEAECFISECGGLPIEGLEEPLAASDASQLKRLQALCTFPLAIDESTELIDANFFNQPPVRRLVIKPAREGGLLTSIERALRARGSGMEVVITSSLESACGLLACAHLAAALAPDAVHGLGTAEWFSRDTGEAPPIINGRLMLPQSNGLGFQPHTL